MISPKFAGCCDEVFVFNFPSTFDSDDFMVEISATTAMENLRSRFYHAIGLERQGFSEGGFCVLPVRRDGDRITW